MSRIAMGLLAAVELATVPGVRAAPPETAAVLAVAPDEGPDAALAELAARLRAALAARDRDALEPEALRARMSGEVDPARLEAVDREIERARIASLDGRYEEALHTLEGLATGLERLPPAPGVADRWERVVLRIVRQHSDLGRQDDARRAAERLVRAAPDVRVDAALNPPRVVRVVEAERQRLRSGPRVRVEVSANAPGARVLLDARDVGAAPLELELAPGTHRIAAAVPGRRAVQEELALTADRAVAVDLSAPLSFRPDGGPGLALPESAEDAGVVEAGALLGVDVVYTVSRREMPAGPVLVGAVHDVRLGSRTREGWVPTDAAGGTRALAEFLATGRDASGQAVARLGAVPEPDLRPRPPEEMAGLPSGPPPPRSGRAGWTSFGAAVAALGLGGVAVWQGMVSNDRYDSADELVVDGVVPPEQEAAFASLRDEGDTARRNAVVLGASAAACAATSAVLGWISWRQTGTVGPIRF